MSGFIKTPAAINDYTFNWNDGYLDTGETDSTSTWGIEPSSTSFANDSDSNTTTTATITLSGGVHGDVFYVTNTIVTGSTSGATRTDDRTLTIRIWEPRA